MTPTSIHGANAPNRSSSDPDDIDAVHRFDKARETRKISYAEWQNSHDLEAKAGRTQVHTGDAASDD